MHWSRPRGGGSPRSPDGRTPQPWPRGGGTAEAAPTVRRRPWRCLRARGAQGEHADLVSATDADLAPRPSPAAVAVAAAIGASPSQIPRDRRLIHERPAPPDHRSVEPVYNRVPTKDSSAHHPHIRHTSSISQVRKRLIRDSRLGHGMPTSRRSVDDLMPKSMARARRRSPLRTLLSASEWRAHGEAALTRGDLGPAGGTAEGANWARVQRLRSLVAYGPHASRPPCLQVSPSRTARPVGRRHQDSTSAPRQDGGKRRVGTIGHPAAVG